MTILEERIIQLYHEEKSLHEIASLVNTNAMKILRILRKNGVPVRDKSAAQKIALKTGRSKHPRKRKELNEPKAQENNNGQEIKFDGPTIS